MKEAQNLEGHRSFVVVAFIQKQKTKNYFDTVSRESESEVVVPGGICTMKTRFDGSRHTSHAQHLYTYIIYYVKTVMNELSVHPPPLLILLQMNNQMKYTTESLPFNF